MAEQNRVLRELTSQDGTSVKIPSASTSVSSVVGSSGVFRATGTRAESHGEAGGEK